MMTQPLICSEKHDYRHTDSHLYCKVCLRTLPLDAPFKKQTEFRERLTKLKTEIVPLIQSHQNENEMLRKLANSLREKIQGMDLSLESENKKKVDGMLSELDYLLIDKNEIKSFALRALLNLFTEQSKKEPSLCVHCNKNH